jgi:putative transposase
MQFESGQLYHIYNRGNNSHPIFFTRENYLFFLKKIKQYISPYADILAWVLMPNHFHLMVYVKSVVMDVANFNTESNTERLTLSNTESLTLSETLSIKPILRSFNDSIGIMLRTYTRAIQKQEQYVGSLFQEHTKAACLTMPQDIGFSWFCDDYELQDNSMNDREGYVDACFQYIHENPVKARLCSQAVDWEFSSAPDYFANRTGKLINRERAKEFGLIF